VVERFVTRLYAEALAAEVADDAPRRAHRRRLALDAVEGPAQARRPRLGLAHGCQRVHRADAHAARAQRLQRLGRERAARVQRDARAQVRQGRELRGRLRDVVVGRRDEKNLGRG
jgi:hypothetical protein